MTPREGHPTWAINRGALIPIVPVTITREPRPHKSKTGQTPFGFSLFLYIAQPWLRQSGYRQSACGPCRTGRAHRIQRR